MDTSCTDAEVHKRGIIETDPVTGRVISFLEKPQATETKSRKQSPCFYLLHPKHLHRIAEFLDKTKDGPIEARDASGNFLKYLIENETVYSLTISQRYDVGGLETYKDCLKAFERKK